MVLRLLSALGTPLQACRICMDRSFYGRAGVSSAIAIEAPSARLQLGAVTSFLFNVAASITKPPLHLLCLCNKLQPARSALMTRKPGWQLSWLVEKAAALARPLA